MSSTITKAYRTALQNAYEAGNPKAIGGKVIENVLHIAYESYCKGMVSLQAAIHDYVMAQAMNDKDTDKPAKMEAAKTAVYDLLKPMIERVPGVLCDAGDILYLMLSGYKLVKEKNMEKDDGSFIIGTKRVVNVSPSAFRVAVESLFGNKIAGRMWDCGLNAFRDMTATEQAKLDQKLEKKRQRDAKAKEKATTAEQKAANDKRPVEKVKRPAAVKKDAPAKKPASKATTKATIPPVADTTELPSLNDMPVPATPSAVASVKPTLPTTPAVSGKDKMPLSAVVANSVKPTEKPRRLDGTAA